MTNGIKVQSGRPVLFHVFSAMTRAAQNFPAILLVMRCFMQASVLHYWRTKRLVSRAGSLDICCCYSMMLDSDRRRDWMCKRFYFYCLECFCITSF